jgi:hypothetical protein
MSCTTAADNVNKPVMISWHLVGGLAAVVLGIGIACSHESGTFGHPSRRAAPAPDLFDRQIE